MNVSREEFEYHMRRLDAAGGNAAKVADAARNRGCKIKGHAYQVHGKTKPTSLSCRWCPRTWVVDVGQATGNATPDPGASVSPGVQALLGAVGYEVTDADVAGAQCVFGGHRYQVVGSKDPGKVRCKRCGWEWVVGPSLAERLS